MSLKPYDKFSSISNKTMIAIFPNVCLWRRTDSYAQNWEVLTLKNCYSIEPPSHASMGYVVASFGLVSFLLFRKNLGKSLPPPPPWQNIARTPMLPYNFLHFTYTQNRCAYYTHIKITQHWKSTLNKVKLFLQYNAG